MNADKQAVYRLEIPGMDPVTVVHREGYVDIHDVDGELELTLRVLEGQQWKDWAIQTLIRYGGRKWQEGYEIGVSCAKRELRSWMNG
jgi:hypothetical protein